MSRFRLCLFVCLISFPLQGWAGSVFHDPHDLLVAALQKGDVTGVLEGDIDARFSQEFRSTEPLHVRAQVIGTLPYQGCKRLQVTFTKGGVMTSQGTTDAVLKTQISYCLDGAPPADFKEES